jgi:preprotein translocase subunit YajC
MNNNIIIIIIQFFIIYVMAQQPQGQLPQEHKENTKINQQT